LVLIKETPILVSFIVFSAISEVVTSVSEFSHRLADVIVFGFATSHAAPIEEGDGKYLK